MPLAPRPHVLSRFGSVATHGDQLPAAIVVHSTESNDAPGTSDMTGVATFWKRQGEGLGAHFLIDSSGTIMQCAWGTQKTYAVSQHNTGKIHIELIGHAWWDLRKWKGRKRQLESLAKLLAYESDRWGIPLHRSTTHGVAEHADFHDVPAGMYHSDPGHGFPMNDVIVRARQIAAAAHAAP